MGNWCQWGSCKGAFAHGAELTLRAGAEWELWYDGPDIYLNHLLTGERFIIPAAQAKYMVLGEVRAMPIPAIREQVDEILPGEKPYLEIEVSVPEIKGSSSIPPHPAPTIQETREAIDKIASEAPSLKVKDGKRTLIKGKEQKTPLKVKK
jgi:hypothetical protein